MQFAKGNLRGRHAKADGRTKAISVIGVAAFSLGMGGISASAQSSSIRPGNAAEVTTAAAAGELTASQVIKDPGAPYENVFRDFGLGLAASPKIGAGQAQFQAGPFNLGTGADTPLTRGFRPEEAELKLGNFYLDIRQLRGTLLYSDNANRTETNRQDDVAAAITLGLTAMYQVTEGLRVAVNGAVIYLPLDNKIGVQGFGLVDPFARFALDGGTLARAQIVYDFTLGKWDVVAYDDFRILNRTAYRLGDEAFLDLYDGETFDGSGNFRNRQVFSAQEYQSPQFQDTTRNADGFDFTAIDYQNAAGVIGTRYLPFQTFGTVAYTHNNFWYSSASQSTALVNRPSSTDRITVMIESVRENLRFKPFASYSASTSDLLSGWDHQVSAGIRGPITDQLEFHGEAGYIFSGNSPRETMMWRLGLNHLAGPYTVHGIRYYRVLTDPDRVLTQRLEYYLTQILGPHLLGGFFASQGEFEDLDVGTSLVTESRIGGYLSYDIGEFGNFNTSVIYRKIDFDSIANPDYSLFTVQMNYTVALGEKTNFRFFYQFEKRDSDRVGNDYYENLVGISVSRNF